MYASESPSVITYINIHISSLCFSLQNNILNHRDLFCISFFNQGSSYFLINVYSDSSQLALKYLKDTEVNINNILIMTGDFNIRDSFWNPNFLYHSTHKDILFDIADSFQLEISKLTEFFPTRYSNNNQNSNSVLNLVFLCLFLTEFDNHHIYPDWRLTSDHALSLSTSQYSMNVCQQKNDLSSRTVMRRTILLKSLQTLSSKWIHPLSKA